MVELDLCCSFIALKFMVNSRIEQTFECYLSLERMVVMGKSKITLSKEVRAKMVEEIKKFFLNERDEEIGDLAAMLMLDFIVDTLSPVFYNQGIQDCASYMKDKLEDLYGLQV